MTCGCVLCHSEEQSNEESQILPENALKPRLIAQSGTILNLHTDSKSQPC